MQKISVVLADERPTRRMRLAQALSSHQDLQLHGAAPGLTEAFSLTEDHMPQVFIVPQSMTERPEFEMMDGLLQALRVSVICLAEPGAQIPGRYRPISPEIDGEHLAREMVGLLRQTAHRDGWPPETERFFDDRSVVVVGASTGGIEALIRILSVFPKHCPPTLIVQHTGKGFSPSLARLLRQYTPANIQEAKDGEVLGPGEIRIAPGNEEHMVIRSLSPLQISLDPSEPVSGHLPSIDALFLSAARLRGKVVGVLLTGMGRDGAAGLKMIRDAGGHTIVQDEATSVIYGMPKAAMDLDAATEQLPLASIGPAVLAACLPDRTNLRTGTAR